MIYGILGDIHGNLEALMATLDAMERRRVDRLVCLGDIVGYNADSNACAGIVQSRSIESIAGNHDLISLGRLGFGRCANKAAFALARTRRVLTPDVRDFLATLPPARVYEGRFLLVHGGIGDVQQYVRSSQQIRDNLEPLRRSYPGVQVCFFGHTHEPKVYEVDGESIAERPAGACVRLANGKTYFVNPGSVDASRKRDHQLAEFGVFDSSGLRMEFHRVPYDHLNAEKKATREGYRIDAATDWLYSVRRRIASAWTTNSLRAPTRPT
jgi:predicted phosphodiesterase